MLIINDKDQCLLTHLFKTYKQLTVPAVRTKLTDIEVTSVLEYTSLAHSTMLMFCFRAKLLEHGDSYLTSNAASVSYRVRPSASATQTNWSTTRFVALNNSSWQNSTLLDYVEQRPFDMGLNARENFRRWFPCGFRPDPLVRLSASHCYKTCWRHWSIRHQILNHFPSFRENRFSMTSQTSKVKNKLRTGHRLRTSAA